MARLGRFFVMIEYFYVTTEFDQGYEFLCRDRVLLCRDRVWPWMGFLCRDGVLLRQDRVFQDMGFPCHDVAFYVATVGHVVAS